MKEFLDYAPSTQEQEVGQEYNPMPIPGQGEREEASEIGIIRELSPKKILEQLRMNLKGYFWDYEQKGYIRIQGFTPLMNDKGIAKYLSIMSSVITDLVTFSNYQADEINRLTLYVCDKAIPTIHINYKDFGIKDKSDLQIIDIQIFNLTLAAFKKAVGAGDRNVVRGTVSESMINRQMMQPQFQPQQQGFLSKLNPFSRR
ncbi:hypothetical protein ES702_01240 [subsurface metagenome]